MPVITFAILGKPIAKKRPRFFRRGKHIGTYNVQETEEGRFCLMLRESSQIKEPIAGPVSLKLIFGFKYPASMPKKKRLDPDLKHVKKPDIDNLLKFFMDCGNGVLWHDDSQVFEVDCRKEYQDRDETVVSILW